MKKLGLIFFLFCLGSFAQAQNLGEACMRIEGLKMPCLTGGVGAEPATCDGTVVVDEAACSAIQCKVPKIIIGSYAETQTGQCRQYAKECEGTIAKDGCSYSCQLAADGNSCMLTQNTCSFASCAAPRLGVCIDREVTCTMKENVECRVRGEDMPGGPASFDPATGCCTCPRANYRPNCGTTCPQ